MSFLKDWGGLVAVVGVAFAAGGWITNLQSKVGELEEKINAEVASGASGTFISSIPIGAVLAFDTSANSPCPSQSWELLDPAKGRFIVGAGIRVSGDLTPRPPYAEDQQRALGGKE